MVGGELCSELRLIKNRSQVKSRESFDSEEPPSRTMMLSPANRILVSTYTQRMVETDKGVMDIEGASESSRAKSVEAGQDTPRSDSDT